MSVSAITAVVDCTTHPLEQSSALSCFAIFFTEITAMPGYSIFIPAG
jgi:hypothetical protein